MASLHGIKMLRTLFLRGNRKEDFSPTMATVRAPDPWKPRMMALLYVSCPGDNLRKKYIVGFWESTYYDSYQAGGPGNTNVFTTAQTFGMLPSAHHQRSNPIYGQVSCTSANGNGVLIYPGTDNVFPAYSSGISGPIASLRLKHWRRGIQDVDYLTLANAINPTAVAKLVNRMVPSVLCERQCVDPKNDCTYTYSPISWTIRPDDWEAARAQLAHIIDGQ